MLPDNEQLLAFGAGRALTGLWYEAACDWIGGNASSVTFQLEYFDDRGGGDFALTSIDVRDVGGNFVSVDGDFGLLHVLPGDGGTLNRWWEGELGGVDAAGLPVQLDAIVFRDAYVETVVGR